MKKIIVLLFVILGFITKTNAQKKENDPWAIKINTPISGKNFYAKTPIGTKTVKPVAFQREVKRDKITGSKAGATVIWQDGFETSTGWTLSGEWEIGAPQGLGGDPSVAYEGNNVLGYDLSSNGRYANRISSRIYATSPVINCSGYTNVSIDFYRYLKVYSSDYVGIEVYDGSTWYTIWSGDNIDDGGNWVYKEYDVSAYADNNPNFQVRFYLGGTSRWWNTYGWNIDDFHVTGDLMGNNTITAGSATEPATIASTINTESDAIINFDFTVNDDGTNPAFDTKNTLINKIIIWQGTGNDVTNWDQVIAGAELTDGTTTYFGTINSDNITFDALPNAGSSDFGYIADNGSKTYTLKVWLLKNMVGSYPETIDGMNLVFLVNPASFGLEATSSGFASGEEENSGSGNNEVTVDATQYIFSQQPSNTATSGVALAQQPIVWATDANENLDLDYSATVTLSNSGGLSMNNNSVSVSGGVGSFTNFMFTTGGKYVTLSASDGSISSVVPSIEIAVDIIGCEIFAEDFEAYGQTTNLPTAGGEWKQYDITSNSNTTWGIYDNGTGKELTTWKTASVPESYDGGNSATIIAYYSQKIDATNFRDLKLYLIWKCEGEYSSSSIYDYGKLVWSTDGTNWSFFNGKTFYDQNSWTSDELDISVADNQQFYIGFLWHNDGSVSGTPSFSIDRFVIRGMPDFDYHFTFRHDVFKNITGTIVSPDANGSADISLPPGFNFQYNGTPVSTVRVNINGWVEMGNSITSSLDNNNLSNPLNTPIIAPLWDDLQADDATEILYAVSGNSPTRIFTIEWKNVFWGGQRQNFQVKLYETSSIIEFWYGTMTEPSSGSASIGINAPGCSVYNRMISVTPYTVPVESYTAENSSINSVDYLTSGTVYIFNPLYMQKYVSWQDATIVVGQNDFYSANTTASQTIAAGANSSAISSKGVLAVGSAKANRVLIWNTLPETNGVAADVVVGQTDFSSTSSGTSDSKLNTPWGVAFSPDGEKFIVADGGNNRVLIWNSIPTSNGQPADVVIGQPNFTSSSAGVGPDKLSRPTGVLVLPDGRMLIADFGNNRVLIYNRIPTVNGDTADVVIGQPDFNSNTAGSGANQLDGPWDMAYTPEGKLLISDDGDPANGNHRVLVFNDVPKVNGASADVVIGNIDFSSKAAGTTKTEFNQPSITCSVEGKLAIADFGNSRIMMYDRVPAYNGAPADFVLGQPYYTTKIQFNNGFNVDDGPDQRNMYYPYSINFDLNGRLYVNGTQATGNGMHRVMVYGVTPTQTSDLEVTIVSDATTYCIYNDVEYTVKLINHGPDDAYNVTVNAQVPLGMIANGYSAQDGSTYNQKSGYWYVPYIAANDTAVLVFTGEVQPELASTNVTAYAYTIASSQKDNDYSNNADNAIVAVLAYYAPTITDIDDQYIDKNSHTIPVISFTVDDKDGLSDIDTVGAHSSNTVLIPEDFDNNIIFGGSLPNMTLDLYPAKDKYGRDTITVYAIDSHGCTNNTSFLVTVGNYWLGIDNLADPTDWHDPVNWSSDVPNSTLEAIIPTDPDGGVFPVISADAECEDLYIEPSASVTLNNSYKLTIYGKTYIKSDALTTGGLVDLNSGSSIGTAGPPIVHKDSVFIERYMTPYAWHYLSGPFETTSNKDLTEDNCSGSYNRNLISYTETYNNDNDGDGDIDYMDGWTWDYLTPNDNPLKVGHGYAYFSYNSCDRTAVFKVDDKVDFNTGDITVTVTNTNDKELTPGGNSMRGWNLIGNPYPSGIDADDFINENNGVIDGTIYFWDEPGSTGFDFEGSEYASYNPTLGGTTGAGSGSIAPDKYISISQAFFVHKTTSSPVSDDVVFKNSMREIRNSYYFKKQQPNVQKVKISVVDPKNHYNEIIIGLLPDATLGVDPKYDGEKLEGLKDFALYSIIGQKHYVNQAIPVPDNQTTYTVPLGIKAMNTGEFRFEKRYISNVDNAIAILLKDNYTDSIINLRKQDSYTFLVDAPGRYNDRFELIFTRDNAPQIVKNIGDQQVMEDDFFTLDADDYFADNDNGDQVYYKLTMQNGTQLPSWIKLNDKTNTITAAPSNKDVGNYKLTLTAYDQYGLSTTQTFNLTVVNVNDPPVVNAQLDDMTVFANSDFIFTVPNNLFVDVDRKDKLTITASAFDGTKLPAWLNFDTETKTFSGKPNYSDVGTYEIKLTATDLSKTSASTKFNINVVLPNSGGDVTFAVFPNPVTDFLNVIASEPYDKIRLVNAQGQIVMEKNYVSDKDRIDVKALPQGVYELLIITGNKQMKSIKISITHDW